MNKVLTGDIASFASGYGLLSIQPPSDQVIEEILKIVIAFVGAAVSRWLANRFPKLKTSSKNGNKEA